MRKIGAIHELSAGVWVVESPIGMNPGDAGGVLCKSPHELVCATLRAAGVEPASYLASFGYSPPRPAEADSGETAAPPHDDIGNPITPSELQAAQQFDTATATEGELNNGRCVGSSCEV